MNEEWIPIKDFPKYDVSNQGRIRSRWRKTVKTLTPQQNSQGYLWIYLSNETSKACLFVHRLVAEAF